MPAAPRVARGRRRSSGQTRQRDGQRPAAAGGPQPGIDLIQPAVRAQPAGGLDDPLSQFAEEVLVGGVPARAQIHGRGPSARRPRRGRRCPGRCGSSFPARRTCPWPGSTISQGLPGAARRRCGGGRTSPPAARIPARRSAPGRSRRCRTARRWSACTSSLPSRSRTPTQSCWSFLKLCRMGSMSSAPRHKLGQHLPQRLARGQLVQHQAVHQAVQHARVAGEDARQVRTVGAAARHTAAGWAD